ncbi:MULTISPECIES: MFS transporter [Streptomyces]|uniref:MFS transporter n=2 Tax=Streptomyces rimosus subsp. rimosus TaxID=132474 RepID=L8EWR2_STRR1|nr:MULTISPECIES: MFS transporter [Streptomyces]KOG77785.1 MFS transporter permease [Kitasatospora aureofaciens]MYT47932.1 MFS transporter [Streptomyces sp. SID5471]KEF06719.1 MFS transporter permease [Streptomyces rimosus]KUJ43274.1 MFS transporter permease [Streptomyces rimosus subsp. rimosus]QDA02564.1 MFS transporter [Streptomyces rimosus]
MGHFRLLVVGNAISAYGSYLNMVALNVFVYQVTGSALTAGLFMAVRLITSVLSGFVSGRLVSRYDRKRLMVCADVTQAAALVVLLLAPDGARVALLFALAVGTGACSTLSQVALRSSVPEIVGADLRTRANGLLVTGRSLAMIAGFASAGVVVAEFGYTAAFALDAGTFAVSATILFLLPIRTRAAAGHDAAGSTAADAAGTGRWASLALLKAAPLLAVMVAVRAADGLGSSSHNVALPIYSSALDPSHPATFVSQFWATWAIGNIVAQQVCSRRTRKTGWSPGERAFALGSCVMSAAFIVVFSGLPAVPAAVAALVAGMADGFTEIAYVSRLQAAPDEQRGRLFGLSASAENSGFGLGMIVSAALLERYSPLQVVGAFQGLAIVLCVALLVVLSRGRALFPKDPPARESGGPAPGREVTAAEGGTS